MTKVAYAFELVTATCACGRNIKCNTVMIRFTVGSSREGAYWRGALVKEGALISLFRQITCERDNRKYTISMVRTTVTIVLHSQNIIRYRTSMSSTSLSSIR